MRKEKQRPKIKCLDKNKRLDNWRTKKGPDDCWPHKLRPDKDGYARVMYEYRRAYLHRLIYEWEVGRIPDGNLIRHSCDNPSCTNPNHLQVGTQKDNIRDCLSRNRKPLGENVVNAKLSEESVKYILNSDLTNRELGRLFGVTGTCIYRIRKRLCWKHIGAQGS